MKFKNIIDNIKIDNKEYNIKNIIDNIKILLETILNERIEKNDKYTEYTDFEINIFN